MEPSEDYVVALDYDEIGFTAHGLSEEDRSEALRFHVGHFRRRIGDRQYALVREQSVPGMARSPS